MSLGMIEICFEILFITSWYY